MDYFKWEGWPTKEKVEKALEEALKIADRYVQRIGKNFTEDEAENGRYKLRENNRWTSSFRTGVYWICYELTGDEKYKNVAMKHVESFKDRLENKRALNHHDLGFLYSLSCVATYRMAITKIISCVFPWVCFFLIAFGIFCVIYGCVKWHKIQTDLDEQTHLDTVMKRLNAEKLTPSEVAERTVNEIIEDTENSSDTPTFTPSRHQEAIMRSFKIEKLFFNYIYKKQHKLYDVQQNIRVGSFEYDVVSVSKATNTDYIYEIKAWNNLVTHAYHLRTLQQLKNATQNYLTTTKRNCITKLIIITQQNYVDEFKKHFDRLNTNLDSGYEIIIEYYTEEQLSK